MFEIDIGTLFPRFLLADRNGYAMAKALEAGLNAFLAVLQDGLDTVGDVEKMPEWRLDEMAWETQCLYDYDAEVAQKREWIKNALPYYRLYGTPKGIQEYLDGFFEDAVLEEASEYSGSAYHFRVRIPGPMDSASVDEAERAVLRIKNVRSVLDSIGFSLEGRAAAYAGAAIYSVDDCQLSETEEPDLSDDQFLGDGTGAYLLDGRGVVLFNSDGEE